LTSPQGPVGGPAVGLRVADADEPSLLPGSAPTAAVSPLGLTAAFVGLLVLAAVLAAVHLVQGTGSVGLGDLWDLATGRGADETAAVLVASRMPRLLAALMVGVTLGYAGTLLQSVSRNPLASPDTLAVNAGAHVVLVLVGVLGVAVPFYLGGLLATAGGLAGALLVLLLARGGADGPSRLILAGAAITLGLQALVTVLLVLYPQETMGLFAWGSGSTVQSGTRVVTLAAPLVVVGILAATLLAHRLDLLMLGDDAATVLGVRVRATRVAVIGVAVVLSATAVTVAGPVGFVGLAAPLLARLVSRRVPGLARHAALLPYAGIMGAAVVLAADVVLRAVVPTTRTTGIPTGIVTTVLGAVLLVWFARRLPDGGPGIRPRTAASLSRPRTRRVALVIGLVVAALLVAGLVAALLLGERLVLLGDVANYLSGLAGREVNLELGRRIPRVLAALLAGAALALAGTITQAVARNPLAEPSLLGVTAGAGLGAVTTVMLFPGVGIWPMAAAAFAGAAITTLLVFALSYRAGFSSERMVLIGVGLSAGMAALTTLVILITAPWDMNLALTWLAGTTYGRSMEQLIPVVLALLLVTPLAAFLHRDLDVVALDEDTPRVLGVNLDRRRVLLVSAAALLTAASVCAVGVVAFVGLVAPHAARALVGARHTRVLPVAMLLGALLVSLADTAGRTVLAPLDIPVGVGTALLGTPYFVYLLWRTRGHD
jgi:ABC-type Fe3+-siderophore transport system permease subunit